MRLFLPHPILPTHHSNGATTPFQTFIPIFPFPSSSDCIPIIPNHSHHCTPLGKANPRPHYQRTRCPHHYHTIRSKSSMVSR